MHEVVERIRGYIRDNEERLIGDLKTLLAQPSISTVGEGIEETASLVAEMMKGAGMRAEVRRTRGHPIVLGELREERHGTLLLYNHYDVQPADPLEKWDSPPFTPCERAGRIFARGACDNKGNLAARIKAVEVLLSVIGEVPVDLKFLVEGEEEIGSPHLPEFVESNAELLGADACVWESGMMDSGGRPVVYLGAKGILYVEIISRWARRDLHSSWGTIIDNPAWRLTHALSSMRSRDGRVLIEGFYDDVEEPSEEVRGLLSRIDLEEEKVLSELGIDSFLAGKRGIDLAESWLLSPTLNICGLRAGYIEEGTKTVLPSTASAKLDFRLVPRMTPDRVLELLKRHLEKIGLGDLEIRALQGYPAARTDPGSWLVELAVRTARVAFEAEPVVYPSAAGSGPMYLVTERLRQPCVGTGICRPDANMHAPNENIPREDFLRAIEQMCLIMINMVPLMRWGETPYL